MAGNFYPYGWYGMKDRGNTLPAWLQKAGYRTALIGKWLNGYGSRDAHGEVPKGFDIWRGLLDVSAYDYHNFVMNQNGKLKTWGDPVFARKLVEFADIQVTPQENPGIAERLRAAARGVRRRAVRRTGAREEPRRLLARRDRPGHRGPGRAREELEEAVLHLVVGRRPRTARTSRSTLMGRPGRDPRPPARYAKRSEGYKLPRPPSFNEPDVGDKPSNIRDGAPALSDAQIEQLQLDYEGRVGLAARRRRPRQAARQGPEAGPASSTTR